MASSLGRESLSEGRETNSGVDKKAMEDMLPVLTSLSLPAATLPTWLWGWVLKGLVLGQCVPGTSKLENGKGVAAPAAL